MLEQVLETIKMKKTTLTGLAATLAAISCVSMAGAQTNGPTGISVRLGGFVPTNNLASDLGTWFGVGVDYKLNTLSATAPITNTEGYFGLSADYYSHGSDNDVPVALTYNLRQGQMVWSVGLGPEFRNAGDLTSTGVGLAEQIGVAYEFGHTHTPFFISAKYYFSSEPELSGFGFYVGARF
jgi:hypothetical protein